MSCCRSTESTTKPTLVFSSPNKLWAIHILLRLFWKIQQLMQMHHGDNLVADQYGVGFAQWLNVVFSRWQSLKPGLLVWRIFWVVSLTKMAWIIASVIGNFMVVFVPLPTWLSTWTVPPNAEIFVFTTSMPTPLPLVSVTSLAVKNQGEKSGLSVVHWSFCWVRLRREPFLIADSLFFLGRFLRRRLWLQLWLGCRFSVPLLDCAGFGLPVLFSFLRYFNAVVNAVSQQVNEWLTDFVKDGSVNFDFSAFHD